MSNVVVFDHPLIQHKLAVLRNVETPVKEFRELIGEISATNSAGMKRQRSNR